MLFRRFTKFCIIWAILDFYENFDIKNNIVLTVEHIKTNFSLFFTLRPKRKIDYYVDEIDQYLTYASIDRPECIISRVFKNLKGTKYYTPSKQICFSKSTLTLLIFHFPIILFPSSPFPPPSLFIPPLCPSVHHFSHAPGLALISMLWRLVDLNEWLEPSHNNAFLNNSNRLNMC